MNTNKNDYKNKELFINHLEEMLSQYQETHHQYFVTITFKSKITIPNEPRQFNNTDYDKFFSLFKNRLNNLALRHSKQKNKCILLAFPEKSYHNPKTFNQDHIKITNQNRSKASFRSQDLPAHYHCILLVHNQHHARFEKKGIKKSLNPLTGKISKTLSEKLSNPYPKATAFENTNLFIQDTDIQPIYDLEGVINYGTKNILYSGFDYDDIYLFVSQNSVE